VSTTAPYTVTGVASVANFQDLEDLFDQTGTDWKDGWKLDLPPIPPVSGEPSARMVKEGALLGNVFLITDFTPSVNLCGGDGTSSLYGLYYKTGTPLAESPILGVDTSNNSIRTIDLGEGMASAPSLHITNDPPETNGDKETVIIQNSRGDIITEDADLPTPVKSGETSWRQQYQ
jgi:type IV pilus assembly protein PilY1